MHPTPDFYNKNLTSLKEHQPEAWAAITSTPPSPMGEIITTHGERANLKITTANEENILLHNEADEHSALQIVPEDAQGATILFGMGLGYEALALCAKRKKIRHIIIFEIHPGIFIQALHCHDLTPLFSDPRLTLVIGPDHDFSQKLAPAALTMQLEHSYILKHRPAFSIDPTIYEELHDKIYDLVNKLNINANTLIIFGESFINNMFSHIRSIHHNYLLENLHGTFKNIPAILVAGGPSLNKNIDQLKKAKGKALIIAVDAALPALLAHDITPDIVGAVDPQKLAYEKIAGVASMAPNTFMICTPSVYNRTPKTFPAKQVLWGFTLNTLQQCVNRALGGSAAIGTTGTVAHMNLDAAASLGCSPIILVGQDLSFPIDGSNDHVDGAVISSPKNKNDFNEQNNQIFWVDGTMGGKVATDRAFLFLKKNFESKIGMHPGHYINASEGGANINGTEVMSLEEAIKTYCNEPHNTISYIEAALAKNGCLDNNQLIAWLDATLKKTTELQKIIKKTDALTTHVSKKIAQLKRTGKPYQCFDALPANLQKQINKIDKGQEQSDKPMEIWSILQEITNEGLRASERLKQEILKLQDQPPKYLEYALKNFERILYTNSVRTIALELLELKITETLSHLRKEKELLTTIEKNAENQQHRMDLARFYFNADELVLAQPLLENLYSNQPDSAEINFYLGCIAARQSKLEKAADFFHTSKTLNPEFEDRIIEFKIQFGDHYFDLWHNKPKYASLLDKGLLYCPNHPKIIAQLDLMKITTAHKSANPEQTDGLIRSWHKKLEEDDSLSAKLTIRQVAEFHAHHGQLLMSEAKFKEASKSLTKASDLFPQNPDYHILLTEALFAIGDFDLGIEHIKKAVAINPAYAKHWEEIGDQLRADQQYLDAISAYEQCLAAQPENLLMLKNIGECYQALNMPEAALKVYTLLKQRLESNNAG